MREKSNGGKSWEACCLDFAVCSESIHTAYCVLNHKLLATELSLIFLSNILMEDYMKFDIKGKNQTAR